MEFGGSFKLFTDKVKFSSMSIGWKNKITVSTSSLQYLWVESMKPIVSKYVIIYLVYNVYIPTEPYAKHSEQRGLSHANCSVTNFLSAEGLNKL